MPALYSGFSFESPSHSIADMHRSPGLPGEGVADVFEAAPRRTVTSFPEEKETSVEQRTYFPETWLWDLLEISLVLMRAAVMSLFFIFALSCLFMLINKYLFFNGKLMS